MEKVKGRIKFGKGERENRAEGKRRKRGKGRKQVSKNLIVSFTGISLFPRREAQGKGSALECAEGNADKQSCKRNGERVKGRMKPREKGGKGEKEGRFPLRKP